VDGRSTGSRTRSAPRSSRRSPTTTTKRDGRAITVGEAIRQARARLRNAASAPADAARLLETTLGRDAAWLLAHDRDELQMADLERYEQALTRRQTGEPLAYIAGHAGFFGRAFDATPDVLVPRPESEGLVDLALAFLRARAKPGPRICDVGTGSGVIAITLACELLAARCTATDSSPSALAIARRNAARHGVADRIDFVLCDVLPPGAPRASFDCIVANLPYVRTGDLPPAPDPTSFEPRQALDGGPDGLSVYRRLFEPALSALARPGLLLMEAGPDTAEPLAGLATLAFSADATVDIHRDYAGHERIVAVRS
jgi:release factor glutamine methyltransferase